MNTVFINESLKTLNQILKKKIRGHFLIFILKFLPVKTLHWVRLR